MRKSSVKKSEKNTKSTLFQKKQYRDMLDKGLEKWVAWEISQNQNPNRRILERPYKFIGYEAAKEVEKTLDDVKRSGKKKAAAFWAVKKACETKGHLYAPEGRVDYFLDLDIDLNEVASRHEELVVIEPKKGGNLYYTEENYTSENIAASELGRLAGRDITRFDVDQLDHFDEFELTDKQREAVETMMANRVGLLTGLPGTGKSVTCRAITWMCMRHNIEPLLLAPTGIAAKRLSKCCRHPAHTCHKAVYSRMEAGFFDQSFVLVDEVSMLDQEMLSWVANLTKGQLVFVGDPNQLPSVGEGEVLYDMIESDVFPHVHLNEIFRSDGNININAKRVCQGKTPKEGDDFVIEPELDIDKIVDEFVNYDGAVQVLSPGWDEVHYINRKIKEEVNPGGEGEFAIGDRVLCTQNDYELEVFNGDIGCVTDYDGRKYTVDLPSKEVEIPKNYARKNLIHAWATTVHRAQGTEYDKVIVVWPDKDWCRYRELFYTAITRGKDQVVVFGEDFGVSTQRKGSRNTFFAEKLKRRS